MRKMHQILAEDNACRFRLTKRSHGAFWSNWGKPSRSWSKRRKDKLWWWRWKRSEPSHERSTQTFRHHATWNWIVTRALCRRIELCFKCLKKKRGTLNSFCLLFHGIVCAVAVSKQSEGLAHMRASLEQLAKGAELSTSTGELFLPWLAPCWRTVSFLCKINSLVV